MKRPFLNSQIGSFGFGDSNTYCLVAVAAAAVVAFAGIRLA